MIVIIVAKLFHPVFFFFRSGANFWVAVLKFAALDFQKSWF